MTESHAPGEPPTWIAPKGWTVTDNINAFELEERVGSKERTEAEKMRKRYAQNFGVSLNDVVVEETPDDVFVYAPGRDDLPRWSYGGNS